MNNTFQCSRYPVRKLILNNKGEVEEIWLYKSPVNGDPPFPPPTKPLCSFK